MIHVLIQVGISTKRLTQVSLLFFRFQFKRMLNKELSHFSESKSGNQISEYICSTFLGKYKNKYLANLIISIKCCHRLSYRKICYKLIDKQQEVDIVLPKEQQDQLTELRTTLGGRPSTRQREGLLQQPQLHQQHSSNAATATIKSAPDSTTDAPDLSKGKYHIFVLRLALAIFYFTVYEKTIIVNT